MASLHGTAVFPVVGNPRAGPSAISHFLSNYGVHFGDPTRFVDTTIHRHNPIFVALAELDRINDDVIGTLGGRWQTTFFPTRPTSSVRI